MKRIALLSAAVISLLAMGCESMQKPDETQEPKDLFLFSIERLNPDTNYAPQDMSFVLVGYNDNMAEIFNRDTYVSIEQYAGGVLGFIYDKDVISNIIHSDSQAPDYSHASYVSHFSIYVPPKIPYKYFRQISLSVVEAGDYEFRLKFEQPETETQKDTVFYSSRCLLKVEKHLMENGIPENRYTVTELQ